MMHRRALIAMVPGLAMAGGAAIAAPVGTAASAPEPKLPLELAYEAIVTLGQPENVGNGPRGKRRRIPITGGTFRGPRIGGTILPEGMDWQLQRPDGVTELEAAYLMRTDDGTLITIRNVGLARGDYIHTTPVFEAPLGPHQWLNESVFTGMIGPAPEKSAVRIMVYRIV